MTFADLTIIAGSVYSRRTHDTGQLAAPAVAVARRCLERLRAGERLVDVAFPGGAFAVRLGLPEPYPAAPGNELFFCCSAIGHPPFQYGLLLPASVPLEPALWGAASLLATSLYGKPPVSEHAVGQFCASLLAAAPVLATTRLTLPDLTADLVLVAADFATCFAAAWLTETAPQDDRSQASGSSGGVRPAAALKRP